jgi:hypothetical protein
MHEHEPAVIVPVGLGSLVGKVRDPGFRLIGPTHRNDGASLGYAAGPHSWKCYLHPPVSRLLRTEQKADA